MNMLVADYQRMIELADDIAQLVSRLELGDSHYLRGAMRVEVTGSTDVSDACAEFENEWSLGRDRISSSLSRLYGFLFSAAKTYEEADTQLAIALFGGESCQIPSTSHAEWWKSLTPDQQRTMIRERPSAIGNLDGLPPEVRYRANANAIREQIEMLKLTGADPDKIAEFESYLKPDPLIDQKIDELRRAGADPETIARLENLRDSQLHGDPPRQIMIFDPSGEGRIAEVHGSLTTADNVVVFVPGIGNDLANFDTTTNSQAQNLYAAGRGDTAVISWMGYDAPSGTELDVVNDRSLFVADRARAEADELVSFTEGLSATAGGSVTIAAHSYGTVLTTVAAQNGMSVDKIILIGDPGVPASNVDEYNGAEVFAIRNKWDPIGIPSIHGSNPTTADFGATVLQGEDPIFPPPSLDPFEHHSSYFDSESTAITNIMSVAESGHQTTDGREKSRFVDDDGSAQDVYLPKF